MELNKDILLLEQINRPVLCVKDGIVVNTNRAAAQMQIHPGTEIKEYLSDECNTYGDFSGGQLSLTLTITQIPCLATVHRTEELDIFLLEQPEDIDKLQAIALAAQQLRIPLNNVMTITDQLLSHKDLEEDCSLRDQAKQINKGLFQLLRLISNMADAQRCTTSESLSLTPVNLTEFFRDIFEKATVLTSDTGITLKYTGLPKPVIGLINEESMERGVYNIISNAVKFSPKGGTVEASLIQSRNLIKLSVLNQSGGIPPQIQGTLFTRYSRQPGVEDGRFGIGLGMTMVRAAAKAHGGTVLIDSPNSNETRVTLAFPLRKGEQGIIRSPILRIGDYAGGWDHGLLELSDALSADNYDK